MAIEVNLGREMAMAGNCRRRGGECPCAVGCKAETELLRAQSQLQDHIDSIGDKLKWLRRVPATVRPNWKMPQKPEGDYSPYAYNDGEQWNPHWFSETEANDTIDMTGDDAWPFLEETAASEDWEKLGFTVAW